MLERDRTMVQGLVTATSIGAFAGMALIGWIMFFDVSSIGSMAQPGTVSPILSTLVIGGSLLKGGLLGFVLGLIGVNMQKASTERGQALVATGVAHA